YEGRIYPLSSTSSKAIADALGFTARFDHEKVHTAYVDAKSQELVFAFEMGKNVRPLDVGLRYMADRWVPIERTSRRASLHSHKLHYGASALPIDVLATVAKELGLDSYERDLFFMRVNFKDANFALIVEKSRSNLLPPGAKSAFYLNQGQVLNADNGQE